MYACEKITHETQKRTSVEDELYQGLVQSLLGAALASIMYVSKPHLTISIGRVHRSVFPDWWGTCYSGVRTLPVQLDLFILKLGLK